MHHIGLLELLLHKFLQEILQVTQAASPAKSMKDVPVTTKLSWDRLQSGCIQKHMITPSMAFIYAPKGGSSARVSAILQERPGIR